MSKPIKKQSPVKSKRGFASHPENICRDGKLKSKGREVQNYFRAWLEAQPDGLDCTRLDALLTYLWDIASAANKQSVDAIKVLLDRGYGKAQQAVELTGADGAPLLSGGIAEAVLRANGDLSGKAQTQ